ncbi:MAG: adhesin [Marinilabiliales bacterium]|nr:MAG: adhesin [Marinilabiliales bacterium]
MSKTNRAKLKNYFLKGSIPTEEHFHDLIDSSVNQADDGIVKDQGEALKIRAEGSNEEMLNFFRNMEDKYPTWKISNRSADGKIGLNIANGDNESVLFLEEQGNVGVGTTSPEHRLDVEGTIAMKARIGTYAKGKVPADGHWHSIITGIEDFSAFEVVAKVSEKGAHAIMHAVALSAYGQSKSKIKKQQGYFGRCRNCIDLRFTGTYYDYSLQIRTKRRYVEGTDIEYNITKLF